MSKRITFDENYAAHLYELALEHFCVGSIDCGTCAVIKSRLEKFIGKKEVLSITRIIKKNGYCNKLIK